MSPAGNEEICCHVLRTIDVLSTMSAAMHKLNQGFVQTAQEVNDLKAQ